MVPGKTNVPILNGGKILFGLKKKLTFSKIKIEDSKINKDLFSKLFLSHGIFNVTNEIHFYASSRIIIFSIKNLLSWCAE